MGVLSAYGLLIYQSGWCKTHTIEGSGHERERSSVEEPRSNVEQARLSCDRAPGCPYHHPDW